MPSAIIDETLALLDTFDGKSFYPHENWTPELEDTVLPVIYCALSRVARKDRLYARKLQAVSLEQDEEEMKYNLVAGVGSVVPDMAEVRAEVDKDIRAALANPAFWRRDKTGDKYVIGTGPRDDSGLEDVVRSLVFILSQQEGHCVIGGPGFAYLEETAPGSGKFAAFGEVPSRATPIEIVPAENPDDAGSYHIHLLGGAPDGPMQKHAFEISGDTAKNIFASLGTPARLIGEGSWRSK